MRQFQKRIGFMISSQTMIPNGGIGQFTKSFVKLMSSYNIKVDIITDKQPPASDFIEEIYAAGATMIYPEKPLPYTDHSAIYMFGDSYNYERMANFRTALIMALENNLYDSIVCNTYESVQVFLNTGLTDSIQMIAYTHLESQIFKDTKNPFLHSVNEMMRQQLNLTGITIGTQSIFNRLQFDDTVAQHLPIPLSEPDLLKEHNKPREGVLFIGRWEEGKNPELYLDLIQQTGLPARVMTSPNGARKFEERLAKISTDYKIKHSIIGKEKVDFITDCRVAFNPSTVESYGMAFQEQMIQLPTVAIEDQRWLRNFDSRCYFTCNKKNMTTTVMDLYHKYPTAESWYVAGALKHFQREEGEVFHKWNECFNDFTPRNSSVNTAAICKATTVKYRTYIEDLNRRIVCIDDIRSVLNNRHRFRVLYTEFDTWLTKDPMFVPVQEEVGLSLFEVIK